MKITEVKTECNFGDIEIGEVYKCDNEYYIKIKPIEDETTKSIITAIHLITGFSSFIKNDAKVTPVEAEIIVKDL